MAKAIKILQREHANMLKVLSVLDSEVQSFRERGALDYELLFAAIDYIESFPDKVHHPKEERYLFAALARRSAEARPLIDALRAEHEREAAMIAKLRAAVEAMSIEVPFDKDEFEKLVTDYTAFVYDHMRKEETELFPLARDSLKPEDWIEIDRAFAENRDPMFDEAENERYRELLSRIIYLSQPNAATAERS